MEDKEDGGASLFPHQVVDFTPAPVQPVLSCTFLHPPTPLHFHIDSGSEARNVRRQSRGPGI